MLCPAEHDFYLPMKEPEHSFGTKPIYHSYHSFLCSSCKLTRRDVLMRVIFFTSCPSCISHSLTLCPAILRGSRGCPDNNNEDFSFPYLMLLLYYLSDRLCRVMSFYRSRTEERPIYLHSLHTNMKLKAVRRPTCWVFISCSWSPRKCVSYYIQHFLSEH